MPTSRELYEAHDTADENYDKYLREKLRRRNAEALLKIAYPWLMDMQAAAAMTDEQQGTDESLEAYEDIRGLCQQVQSILERR